MKSPFSALASHAERRPRAVLIAPRADADPVKILAEIKSSFEAFKVENDAKLKAKADVVLDEKVDRINADVTRLQAALDTANLQLAGINAGAGGDRKPMSEDDRKYAETFREWFVSGEKSSEVRAAQKTGIRAALSVGSAGDGGYTAPIEWDREIDGKLKTVSAFRQNASVKVITGAGYTHLYNDRVVGSGWVGETAARPATATPTLAPLTFTPGQIYAFPFATQDLLDDSTLNIEQWLADEVETEFSRQENIAFAAGDGVNKPFGLLTYVTGAANAAKHPWGAIPVTSTGHATLLTTDSIISIIYDLPAEFQANAKFYMNRATIAAARKLKDTTGQYIWQPSYAAGQPATIAGQPIIDLPDVPNVAASAIAALYGDLAATYVVVDRLGIRVKRDDLTNKPYIGLYTTKRVGGGVKSPEPMRALKVQV
jgi:HK97 family phage major capsid protein